MALRREGLVLLCSCWSVADHGAARSRFDIIGGSDQDARAAHRPIDAGSRMAAEPSLVPVERDASVALAGRLWEAIYALERARSLFDLRGVRPAGTCAARMLGRHADPATVARLDGLTVSEQRWRVRSSRARPTALRTSS
jgi:hypothetical protein